MTITYMICNAILVAFMLHPFVRKNDSQLRMMLLQGFWVLFDPKYVKALEETCRQFTKEVLSKSRYNQHLVPFMVATILSLAFKLALVWFAFNFCSYYLAMAYLLFVVIRLPIMYAAYKHIKRYLENPELVTRVL